MTSAAALAAPPSGSVTVARQLTTLLTPTLPACSARVGPVPAGAPSTVQLRSVVRASSSSSDDSTVQVRVAPTVTVPVSEQMSSLAIVGSCSTSAVSLSVPGVEQADSRASRATCERYMTTPYAGASRWARGRPSIRPVVCTGRWSAPGGARAAWPRASCGGGRWDAGNRGDERASAAPSGLASVGGVGWSA